MQRGMFFILVGLGIAIIVVALIATRKSVEPMYLNFICASLIVIGTGFGVWGTLLQNKKDDENAKADRDNGASLKKQVDTLQSDLANKNAILVSLSQKNIDLAQKNTDLANRVSDRAIEIFDLSKKIKFPLPGKVTTSYKVLFKLDKTAQENAEKILLNNQKVPDINFPNKFEQIDPELAKKIVKWEIFSNLISVSFAQQMKISPEAVETSTMILQLSNHRDVRNNPGQYLSLGHPLFYNPSTKQFLISFEDIELFDDNDNLSSRINTKSTSKSVFDLENSIAIYNQQFPKSFNSVEISFFRIWSRELSLTFANALPTDNNSTFLISKNVELV
jgi:hypothetical protein